MTTPPPPHSTRCLHGNGYDEDRVGILPQTMYYSIHADSLIPLYCVK